VRAMPRTTSNQPSISPALSIASAASCLCHRPLPPPTAHPPGHPAPQTRSLASPLWTPRATSRT
jgi:hypothetical protein